MKRGEYYRGRNGRKYGIWNTAKKCFQFGISEDSPMLAEASIAVKSGAICELFNLKKESLRAVVNCLRSDGYPVCSSCRGYWYSEKPEDIDKTLKHLEGRISGMQRAITGLKRIRSGE